MEDIKSKIKDFYVNEGLNPSSHQQFVYSKVTSQVRFNAVCTLLREYFDGHKFLEVGCAEGLYCEMMSWIATLVIGVDISKPKLERTKNTHNIIYFEADWDSLPFISDSFDLALATEVLEHSLDPQALVDSLFTISNKVVATVPINETLSNTPFEGRKSGHLHAFRPESFKMLFSKYKIDHYSQNDEIGFALIGASRK